MNRIILLIVALWLLVGCSSRVVHEPQTVTVGAPDAININTAPVDDLEKLPHIGRKTAENIVQFRSENGPFRRVEHIMQIRGISESRFTELRPYIKAE